MPGVLHRDGVLRCVDDPNGCSSSSLVGLAQKGPAQQADRSGHDSDQERFGRLLAHRLPTDREKREQDHFAE